MSLHSLTSRDTITIKRLGATQDSIGAQVRTYSTANRGTRPTSAKCRAQMIEADEAIKLGLKGAARSWKFFFSTNPSIDIEDLIEFTDQDSEARIVKVKKPQRNLDGQGRCWLVLGEEVTNEQ